MLLQALLGWLLLFFFKELPLTISRKISPVIPLLRPRNVVSTTSLQLPLWENRAKKRSDRHGSSPTPPDSGSSCVARARGGRRETPNEAQCLRRLAISDPGLPLSKADLLGCVLFPELQELHKRSFINLDWWYQEMMQHTIDHQPFLATLWNWELSSGARD